MVRHWSSGFSSHYSRAVERVKLITEAMTFESGYLTINDTMSNATMLMTLIMGLIAGPAVSL